MKIGKLGIYESICVCMYGSTYHIGLSINISMYFSFFIYVGKCISVNVYSFVCMYVFMFIKLYIHCLKVVYKRRRTIQNKNVIWVMKAPKDTQDSGTLYHILFQDLYNLH